MKPGAAVALAAALGRWREATSIAAITAEARRTQAELASILREQAATCDAEVNQLADEVEAWGEEVRLISSVLFAFVCVCFYAVHSFVGLEE